MEVNYLDKYTNYQLIIRLRNMINKRQINSAISFKSSLSKLLKRCNILMGCKISIKAKNSKEFSLLKELLLTSDINTYYFITRKLQHKKFVANDLQIAIYEGRYNSIFNKAMSYIDNKISNELRLSYKRIKLDTKALQELLDSADKELITIIKEIEQYISETTKIYKSDIKILNKILNRLCECAPHIEVVYEKDRFIVEDYHIIKLINFEKEISERIRNDIRNSELKFKMMKVQRREKEEARLAERVKHIVEQEKLREKQNCNTKNNCYIGFMKEICEICIKNI